MKCPQPIVVGSIMTLRYKKDLIDPRESRGKDV